MAQYLTSTYYYVCNRVRIQNPLRGKTLGKGVEYTYEKKTSLIQTDLRENFSKMKLGQELSFSGSEKVVPNF